MKELERIFKGLADHTRLRIVNLLLHGELCVCDIQYVLDSPQPNVSRHLSYLKHSGLVLDRREGQRMYYRLAEQSEVARRQLLTFLKGTFAGSEEFAHDSRKLRKAIERGACTASTGGSSSLVRIRATRARGASRQQDERQKISSGSSDGAVSANYPSFRRRKNAGGTPALRDRPLRNMK